MAQADPKVTRGADIDAVLAAWRSGDWEALAALADDTFDATPDGARLTALAAGGLASTGRLDAAKALLSHAVEIGCPGQFAAEVMLSATYQTLARCAILLPDEALARRFLSTSSAIAGGEAADEGAIASRLAVAVEKARLGKFEAAMQAMTDTLEVARDQSLVSSAEGRAFETQIGLLNHVVSLALSRGQVGPGMAGDGAAPASWRSQSLSQLGQDLWVLEQTGMKRGGFFVEFGATDGIILSNSRLLEKQFGWDGICAEPNPKFYDRLVQNRSCTCAPDCIAGETGKTVEFILADEYGGIRDFADVDTHSARRKSFSDMGKILRLETISLDDFLRKYGAPERIDYMSVDTEGSEYEILKDFPFDKWDIRLLTIEHNYSDIRADLQALMARHGYRCVESQWDDWYIKDND